MRYIIMAFAPEGYQEFMLPELDNADYKIILQKKIFGVPQNIEISMEIVDRVWKFVPQEDLQLTQYDGSEGYDQPIQNGMILQIHGIADSRITLVCFSLEKTFPIYDKYYLDNIGQITIGKDLSNTIIYDFKGFISRNHAVIYKYNNQWVIQDNSSNGVYLQGKRVKETTYLKFGDQITIFGLRLMYLGSYLAVCAMSGEYQLNSSEIKKYNMQEHNKFERKNSIKSEKKYFKRSPRVIEELYAEEIEIDAPPVLNKTKKRPLLLTIGPSLTMAIPMLLGCMMSILGASRNGGGGIYMFTGVVTAVSSAIIGVIWALTNLRYVDKEELENEEIRYNAYGNYLIEITEMIKEKYESNKRALFCNYLSGAECCEFSKNDVRLWNHNEHQKDFMMVRLGTGTLPFQAEIKVPKKKFTLIKDDLADKPFLIRDSYMNLYSVPVCIDLRDKGLIGLIGGVKKQGAYEISYNIIAQLAANNCYTDVKMVFIYANSEKSDKIWSFAKWLPHVWMDDKKTRLIASEKSEIGDIFYELSNVIRMRTEDKNQTDEFPLPHYVIFLEAPELIEGELLESYIYNPKPEYGITTIILSERYDELPNSCEYIIDNSGKAPKFFHVFQETENSRDLVIEKVTKTQLESFARKISNVEVNQVTGNGEIPNGLDFLEMFEVNSLEQLNVLERWKKNRNYENMRVPIGQKNGGAICYLDVHEKYHGPHGLVAGTTGSGKSETLQTYILSLAVNFSPDDVAFFIIDFKGGGMANLFSNLPHMAGQISNLSGNQVRRAMISIKSENQRRQRIFAEHNVNNINLYTRLYKNHEAENPVPHLFIIIDEFAELKREEPEFMKELISVAQVGRSLGVHLILATQKPSGTVDDNIWSNSKFRLCLRVQDKQDSNDMLHKPDAAYITQAGRGFLQVGNDEIFEQFQSGYSGADYIEDSKQNRGACITMIDLTGKPVILTGRTQKKRSGDKKKISQLDAVILHLQRIAEQNNYGEKMLLWLPVLPEELYLEQLKGYTNGLYNGAGWTTRDGKWRLQIEVGLYDDPVNQSQEPFIVNFSEGGHLAVTGTVSTGKSTFVQSMLYGLVSHYSPQELNFYILDYSSRLLLPFEKAPHCGGVIIDTDDDKVKKFFFLIEQMMEERKNLFKGGNYKQYIQSCKSKNIPENMQLPPILVVIDNYSNFREKTNSQFDDVMVRLSREGGSYGIYIVATSAGFGSNEIPNRVADNIRTVVSLEMGDKFKYAEVLRTSRVEIEPEIDVKGRGLAYVHGNILEFQTALPFKAKDSYEIMERIEMECEKMSEGWKNLFARQIPIIPKHPIFADFIRLEEYGKAIQNDRYVPLAYKEKDASVYSIDLWNTFCYFIQGKNRTGKKNVMKMLLYATSRKENMEIYVIENRGQEFKALAEQLCINYLCNETEIYEFFKGTIPLFKERNGLKQKMLSEGYEISEVAQYMTSQKQIIVFIADLVEFIKAVYQPDSGVGNISSYLENITEKGSYHGFYFFGNINQEQAGSVAGRKIFQNMSSYKTGIHLGGNISSQRVFQFSNISYQEQTKTTKPGIGYVPNVDDSGIADTVVLPLVKGGFS